MKDTCTPCPLITRTYVKVFITKTNKFRVKISEPEKPAYEVTIGGNNWQQGIGSKYRNQILEKCQRLLTALQIELKEVSVETKFDCAETKFDGMRAKSANSSRRENNETSHSHSTGTRITNFCRLGHLHDPNKRCDFHRPHHSH